MIRIGSGLARAPPHEPGRRPARAQRPDRGLLARDAHGSSGETVFPFLAMSAFVLVYRGLDAPAMYEAFVVLGGAMIAYWNNVLWSMASQFFWEKEQGQLQLYLITPVSRMSILLGMALGGMLMTTTPRRRDPAGGRLLFHVPFPLDRALARALGSSSSRWGRSTASG